jgi:crotonobetainyl-CoA:carnitine CoA-transferase CaiB-like acyl-CoA transferase
VRPLEDVRIVAVEQYGAGPFGTVHLADLGAEVIKIEDPRTGGDVGRYVPPYQEDEDSLFFQTFNRNKRSISVDLSSESGRKVFEDLVKVSDAVYSNLRGDLPERMQLRYEDLKHLNPAIVCCSLSGYGMSGPRRSQPAYDYMLQGIAGWMSLTGDPDGPPMKTGLSLVDFTGGYVAALSMMIGIYAARRDGVGMDCDVSLFEVAMGMLTYPATWHLTVGYEPERTSNSSHPSLVPFQNFITSDGYIVVGCAKEKFWHRLCETIDRQDLLEDPRFTTFAERGQHKDELIDILSEVFRAKPSDHWVSRCEDAGVPVAPINDVGAAVKEEQTIARNLISEQPNPTWGTVRQIVSPVRVGEAAPSPRSAPERGADTADLLEHLLGYSADDVERLRNDRAFGDIDPKDDTDGL